MRLTILAISALVLVAGPASAQSSLYQRLGGYPAIKAVVDDFVGNVAARQADQPVFRPD
jgi:truncated hemoglobin YjbI